jgi:hypothetical protein
MAAIRTIPPSVVRAMRNKRAGQQKPAVSNSGDKCRRTAKFRQDNPNPLMSEVFFVVAHSPGCRQTPAPAQLAPGNFAAAGIAQTGGRHRVIGGCNAAGRWHDNQATGGDSAAAASDLKDFLTAASRIPVLNVPSSCAMESAILAK